MAEVFSFQAAEVVECLVAGDDEKEVFDGVEVLVFFPVFPEFDDDVLGYILGAVAGTDKL